MSILPAPAAVTPSSPPGPCPSPPRAVLFDVDGTLYSQQALRLRLLGRMLVAGCSSPWTSRRELRAVAAFRQAHEAMRGQAYSRREQVALAAATSGETLASVEAAVGKWMDNVPLALLPGCMWRETRALIAEFALRIPLGVVSDYPAIAKLRAMGILEHFSVVVCADDVGRLKPAPDGIREALRRLSVTPENALYVGDRPIDAQAAAAAGVASRMISGQADWANLRRLLPEIAAASARPR